MAMAHDRRPRVHQGEEGLAEHNRLALKAYVYHPYGGFSYKTPLTQDEAVWRGITPAIQEVRNAHNKEVINMALKLPEPFPSSPHRPPKITMHFTRADKNIATHGFCQPYAARYFFDAIVQKDKFKWRDDDTIIIPSLDNLVINCDKLEDVLDHKLGPKEREWELPEPYTSYAQSIRTGERVLISPKRSHRADGEQKSPSFAFAEAGRDQRKRSLRQSQQRARASRDGLTSLADICAELKLDPREARQTLRKSNTPKPDAGWAWPDKEIPGIKKLLKGG